MALGLVLTPFGRIPGQYPFQILRSGPDNGSHLKPFDYQYQTRGESGFYYDTPLGMTPAAGLHAQIRGLGALPTDAEQGRDQCYTPVSSGWIHTGAGYMAPPWTPTIGPGPGLGQDGVATSTISAEEAHRRRMFLLSLISTTAVVAVSLVNLYRSARAVKRKEF